MFGIFPKTIQMDHSRAEAKPLFSVLFFYFYITNSPRTQWLETTFIYQLAVLQFRIQSDQTGFYAQGITRLKSEFWPDRTLIWRLWERNHFQAYQIVGRIQVLVSVGLRSRFPCWLLAGVHCQHWMPLSGPCTDFLHLQSQEQHVKAFSQFHF